MILMFQVFLVTVYVTLDSTRPSMPFEELEASRMEKVMESAEKAVTLKVRNDQLLVPLCSVLLPSFCSVLYVTPSIVYCPLPMRLAYRPGMALYTGWPGSLAESLSAIFLES